MVMVAVVVVVTVVVAIATAIVVVAAVVTNFCGYVGTLLAPCFGHYNVGAIVSAMFFFALIFFWPRFLALRSCNAWVELN